MVKVSLLGYDKPLLFTQDEEGLKIEMPITRVGDVAYAFKIEGLLIK